MNLSLEKNAASKHQKLTNDIPYPKAPEIERSILGALLIYYDKHEDAFNLLEEDDFVDYKTIFNTMSKLYRNNGTFNISDLEASLRENNYKSYSKILEGLIRDTTTDLKHSISQLKYYTAKRKAVQFAHNFIESSNDESDGIEQLIRSLETINSNGQETDWWYPVNPYNEKVEPLEFIIEGFAAKGMLTLIGGTAGSGKSILTQYLMQLRDQQTFLKAQIGNGVFLTGLDSSETEIRRRAKTIGKGDGLSTVEIPNHIIPFITNRRFFSELQNNLKETETDIVVFDTVADFHEGSLYDAADALKTMSAFRRLAKSTGCAVVLITHTRKSADNKSIYSINDIADSRIFSTKSDFVFALKSEYQNDSTNLIELQCLKSRSPKPLAPKRAIIMLNEAIDKLEIEGSDRPFLAEAEKMKEKEKIKIRRERVKELSANGMSNREISDELGVSHTTINNDLKKIQE